MKPSSTLFKRLALGIEYDGAPWHGWQTQPHRLTVQDQLETALQKFTVHPTPVPIICAGRTDAGVHATQQIVHFDTSLDRELASWVRGVNAFLPASIAVRWAHAVTDTFHARFSAQRRTYHYVIYNHPIRSPLLTGKAGWVFRPLNADVMREAAVTLLGTHDFSAFRSAQCQAASPIRTLHDIHIQRTGPMIVIRLTANAFLHHMVRNIVGSLIAIGTSKQPVDWCQRLLKEGQRQHAAPTFMPDGLYLTNVDYDPKWQLPIESPLLFCI